MRYNVTTCTGFHFQDQVPEPDFDLHQNENTLHTRHSLHLNTDPAHNFLAILQDKYQH